MLEEDDEIFVDGDGWSLDMREEDDEIFVDDDGWSLDLLEEHDQFSVDGFLQTMKMDKWSLHNLGASRIVEKLINDKRFSADDWEILRRGILLINILCSANASSLQTHDSDSVQEVKLNEGKTLLNRLSTIADGSKSESGNTGSEGHTATPSYKITSLQADIDFLVQRFQLSSVIYEPPPPYSVGLTRKTGTSDARNPQVIADLSSEVEIEKHISVFGGVGYSDIFLATWRHSIKVLVERPSPGFANTLKREMGILARLRHPNIVPRLGTAVYEGVKCMVTPYMQNGDIREYLRNHPDANRLNLIRDIALGASYLHGQLIVHGDLTPENVLVDDCGQAILLAADFGASLEDEKRAYVTLRYAPPEAFYGDEDGNLERYSAKTLSQARDVWSFGMTCYAIISGDVPYADARFDVLAMKSIISRKLPLAAASFSQYGQLWDLLQKCWCWNPMDRPTMDKICSSLQQIQIEVDTGDKEVLAGIRMDVDCQDDFDSLPSYEEVTVSTATNPSLPPHETYKATVSMKQSNADGILVHTSLFERHYGVSLHLTREENDNNVALVIKGGRHQVIAAADELEKVVKCQTRFGTNVCHPTAKEDRYESENSDESEEVEDYNGWEDL